MSYYPYYIMIKELSHPKVRTCPPCPKCKNYETYRIPRSFLFKSVLAFIPVKRYQCDRCFNKFHALHDIEK